MNRYKANVDEVIEKIDKSCSKVDRNPADIKLICVSKTKSIEDIVKMVDLGISHFGENRSNELNEKRSVLQTYQNITWNYIGHLQSSQIKEIVNYSSIIHSIDNFRNASLISRYAKHFGKNVQGFLQVNISGEETKSGFNLFMWNKNPVLLDNFVVQIQEIEKLNNLRIIGLMTMAPNTTEVYLLRQIFHETKQLANHLNSLNLGLDYKELSMGMSNDYEIAIEEGATYVRIGSTLFK
ncbi:MAG: YggS family pyridoxal phosphate-dependent enzyme [Saprospiraceae bacterium]|nr:YggS family pyridoxal phosphate-dependent enzyme [Saprospiraceae bacterium]